MLTKAQILTALTAHLQPLDYARAASLGGSDATGCADDLSDIDLFVFVTPGAIEHTASTIRTALESLSPITVEWRLPMPTWHGSHQAFYQLKDAPEHLMIDWVMIEAGTPHPWLEVERHGHHHVLFDKDHLLIPAHIDHAAIQSQIRTRLAELRTRFQLFRHLPLKLIIRNKPVDAIYFYTNMLLKPLVDLLRIAHCPDRFDYGFRYLSDDLPPAEFAIVHRLAYPRDADELRAFCPEVIDRLEGLLAKVEGSLPVLLDRLRSMPR